MTPATFFRRQTHLLQQLLAPPRAAPSHCFGDEIQLLLLQYYLLPFQLCQDFALLCGHDRGSLTVLQVFQTAGDQRRMGITIRELNAMSLMPFRKRCWG